MSEKEGLPAPDTEIVFYQTEDGKSRIQVRLQDGTVWLNQRLLAELYQVSMPTINEHISTIYSDHEQSPEATIRKFLIAQTEGIRRVERLIDLYSLDMILAIGYRVRSHRGIQFRRWATERLREFMVKGFILDDQRLKGEQAFGQDYFDELLERIRDIRASEKRFYQKVRDIYTLSIDYDPQAESTQAFFKIGQNKLHWAITGHTAAEIMSRTGQCLQAQHGAYKLERRPCPSVGHRRGQELPPGGRNRRAQPAGNHVVGLRRGPDEPQKANLHEGLAGEAGFLPAVQPAVHTGAQRKDKHGRGQAAGPGAVPGVQPAANRGGRRPSREGV